MSFQLCSYKANVAKPLAKGEYFKFKGYGCRVTKVFSNGIQYEYTNPAYKHLNERYNIMFIGFDYLKANGSKPFSQWIIK